MKDTYKTEVVMAKRKEKISETTNRGVTIFSEIFHYGYTLICFVLVFFFSVVFVLTNLSLCDFDLLSRLQGLLIIPKV